MKKLVISSLLCSLHLIIQAQQPYPTAPPAPGNINTIEYSIDNFSGFGTGSLLTGFTVSPDISNFAGTVNITGVTSGFHRIYFRSKDANGTWSHAHNAFFDNYSVPVYNSAPPAPVNITNIEYFIDNNQVFGSGTPLTGFTASTDINSFNGTVNLGTLPPGFHRFYIRTRDASGKWSMTHNSALDNFSAPVYNTAPPAVVNVTQLEYFIDNNDLGFGNCVQIPFTTGTDIASLNANINITGLPSGVHRLFIRSKDANGIWSLTNFSVFDNSAIMPYPAAPGAPPAVSNMEYFIDSDPGFGNATPLTVPGNPGDISNYAVNINLSGSLGVGTHYLYIRSKQNPWSITSVVPFTAASSVPVTWMFVKAQVVNKKTLVSWATAQESNTLKFEIEHSKDGRSFGKVGEVAAAGNSSSIRNYSLTHAQPVSGFNYYRIKQIDLDGQFKYSAVVTVLKREDLFQTLVAPNPVKEVLNIVEPKDVYVATAEIYTISGSLLMRKTIKGNVQVYSLPVSNLTHGNYILKITYKSDSKTFKFIKE